MERFFNREHDSILKEVEKSSKGSKVIKTKFFQKFDNNNDSFYSICHNIVKILQLVSKFVHDPLQKIIFVFFVIIRKHIVNAGSTTTATSFAIILAMIVFLKEI